MFWRGRQPASPNSVRFISNLMKAMTNIGVTYRIALQRRNQLDGELRRSEKESVTTKMMRIFLIGMLCGVMTMAAVTLMFDSGQRLSLDDGDL